MFWLFSLMFLFSPQVSQPVVVPFEVMNGHLYITASLGGQPISWLVDTGAALSLVDNSIAARLGVKASRKQAIVGPAQTLSLPTSEPHTLDIAGSTLPVSALGLVDLRQLSRQEGRTIEGILGYDLFAAFQVEIDYERQELLLRTTPRSSSPEEEQISIQLPARRPVVSTQLQDKTTSLILDTGASASLYLSESYAAQQKLLPETRQQGRAGSLGATQQSSAGRISQLSLGSVSVPDVICMFGAQSGASPLETEVQGLLGQRFLSRLHLTIDYRSKQIFVRPRTVEMSRDTLDSSGVSLHWVEDALYIRAVRPSSPAARAGLQGGDQLLSLDGQSISRKTWGGLEALLWRDKETRTLQISRSGVIQTVTIPLSSML